MVCFYLVTRWGHCEVMLGWSAPRTLLQRHFSVVETTTSCILFILTEGRKWYINTSEACIDVIFFKKERQWKSFCRRWNAHLRLVWRWRETLNQRGSVKDLIQFLLCTIFSSIMWEVGLQKQNVRCWFYNLKCCNAEYILFLWTCL